MKLSKVVSITVQDDPSITIEPPVQPSMLPGKPDPRTVIVVPPPTLPAMGELLNMAIATVWEWLPVAKPADVTTTLTS